MIKSTITTLKFILGHPLSGKKKLATLRRWLGWQIGSRILRFPVIAPFVNDSCLVLEKGQRGANGNYYCGMLEFEDMSFLMHYLRPDDLFADIGANIGSYTILAACAIGAKVVAVEPVQSTFDRLVRNIAINGSIDRVEFHRCALGSSSGGTVRLTQNEDAENHVIPDGENLENGVEVPLRSLDDILHGRVPRFLKIDVEGFEQEVLKGGMATLRDPNLKVLIIELNTFGSRFGVSDSELADLLQDCGFSFFAYQPRDRRLVELADPLAGKLNVICLRDDEAQERVRSAPAFRVSGQTI